jgi:outer membrane protein assembly factor BamB
MFGHDPTNSRNQDLETIITRGRAPALAPVWTFSVKAAGGAGDITGTPIVADGCVYLATNGGWAFGLNADTGDVVWRTQLQAGVNSTVAAGNGLVYAHVNRVSSPYLVALDQNTGEVQWETILSTQEGQDIWSSPVLFNGMVFSGLAGGLQGGFAIVDAVSGALLKQGWTVPLEDQARGFAGGSMLATTAIDEATGYAYVGTGSAPDSWGSTAHPNVDSLDKVDVDPNRATFGTVVGSYKGLTAASPVVVPESTLHGSPNLFADSSGRKLVGAYHKTGLYYVAEAATMDPAWTGAGGAYFPLGGNSTAFDGRAIYGTGATPGHAYSMDKDSGLPRWLSPIADGAHVAQPPAVSNGVMYTVDTKGFLDAYDTATGLPLLHRPMALGAGTGTDPVVTLGSGVSVARNTVYAAVGTSFGDAGYIIAFRPDPSIPDLPLP